MIWALWNHERENSFSLVDLLCALIISHTYTLSWEIALRCCVASAFQGENEKRGFESQEVRKKEASYDGVQQKNDYFSLSLVRFSAFDSAWFFFSPSLLCHCLSGHLFVLSYGFFFSSLFSLSGALSSVRFPSPVFSLEEEKWRVIVVYASSLFL